jgi:tetratricopeptide (TPR) repeat protein
MNKMLVGLIVGALLGGNGLAQIPEEAQQAEAYYHFSRAMALEGSGQWEAALEEFEKALAIDPTNSMIYSEMAAAYFRRRQVEEATEYGERAIRADADNLDAHQLLSTIYSNMLGQATARGVPPEIIDKAIEEFEHIVRLDPNERDAYLMLGRLYRFKNDPERATEVYRDFLKIAPGSEEGAISLAELQINAGNVEEAIEILKKFNEEQPGSQAALTTLGDAYARLEDFNGASDAYSGALLLDENNIDLMRSLAQALFFADRFDEADELYQKLIGEDPEYALAYLRIGQSYRDLMKYDEAREHLEKAAQLVPDSTEIQN